VLFHRLKYSSIMKFKLILFGIAGLVPMSALSQAATLLYSTDFNSPTYVDGPLLGPPAQDGWLITGTSVVNPIAVSNTATNGVVAIGITGQDINRPFTAVTPATASNVFLAVTINISAAGTGDYFLHLGDGGSSNFYSRLYTRAATDGFVMGMSTSSGTVVYSDTILTFGSYNLLLRYDFIAGATNDTGALFVNPTTLDGSGDTAYTSATTVGADAASISSVNIRQGTSATTMPTLTLDNITVSANLIPEPATALLGALGFIGILRRRR
jgi:hypothetical protein